MCGQWNGVSRFVRLGRLRFSSQAFMSRVEPAQTSMKMLTVKTQVTDGEATAAGETALTLGSPIYEVRVVREHACTYKQPGTGSNRYSLSVSPSIGAAPLVERGEGDKLDHPGLAASSGRSSLLDMP